MKTADFSNLVILMDGIKNNHAIELTTTMNKRVFRVSELDRRYVFFLRKAKELLKGKYIFNESENTMFWFTVTAFGNFVEGVNSKTIRYIHVSSMFTRNPREGENLETYKTRLCAYSNIKLQDIYAGIEGCQIMAMYSQDDLIQKSSAKVRNTTRWEMLCYRLKTILRTR